MKTLIKKKSKNNRILHMLTKTRLIAVNFCRNYEKVLSDGPNYYKHSKSVCNYISFDIET